MAGWSGDDWEEYCDPLFAERHAPAGYQRVPDRDQGDLGFEGFTVDGSGCAYQCYADEQPDLKSRYEGQRDKMSEEVRKLILRKARVGELIGVHVLHRWVFVVPIHDSKQLVSHARRKEMELKEAGLDFIAEDFAIVIETAENFVIERAKLEDFGAATVTVVADDVDEAAVATFKREEAEQVVTMDRKLQKVIDRPAVIRDRMLHHALDEANIRENLRRNHPLTAERVTRQIEIERRNVLDRRDLAELHKGSIVAVREKLATDLQKTASAIGDDQASRVAHGTIARWLMECPMDFPEPS